MNQVLEHLEAELALEEGDKNVIYDDATGKPLRRGDTLEGNLTVGEGLNLMGPFDPVELQFIENNRIAKAHTALLEYPWFSTQDMVRQVALADIAYNIGLAGLLNWPHFLSFMGQKDYPAAVAELKSDKLWISQVKAPRANRIETMLATGQWPPDVPLQGAAPMSTVPAPVAPAYTADGPVLPAPIPGAAIPWYQSAGQKANVITAVSALIAISPKVADKLGLTTPATVEAFVEVIFTLAAMVVPVIASYLRAHSPIQPLTLTVAAAVAHPATQAALQVAVAQAAAAPSLPDPPPIQGPPHVAPASASLLNVPFAEQSRAAVPAARLAPGGPRP